MFIPCVCPETCGYQKEALDPALVWVTIAVVKHMTKGKLGRKGSIQLTFPHCHPPLKEARTGGTQLGRDLQRSQWVLLTVLLGFLRTSGMYHPQ